MTVTNPKLRAKLDRMYRDPNSRWREYFLDAYENGIDHPRDMACIIAGNSKWLKLDDANRDQMSIRIKKRIKDR